MKKGVAKRGRLGSVPESHFGPGKHPLLDARAPVPLCPGGELSLVARFGRRYSFHAYAARLENAFAVATFLTRSADAALRSLDAFSQQRRAVLNIMWIVSILPRNSSPDFQLVTRKNCAQPVLSAAFNIS